MLGRLRYLFRDDGGPSLGVEDVVDTQLPEQTTTAPVADTDLIGAQGDKASQDATEAWLKSPEGQAWLATSDGQAFAKATGRAAE